MQQQLTFSGFATRLRDFIRARASFETSSRSDSESLFNALALELFALQYESVSAYQRLCIARKISPESVADWRNIPALPTSAFKDFELSSLPIAERTTTFHSSGTTEQRPSRHFHSADSLSVYEESLRPWFQQHLLANLKQPEFIILAPPPEQAPNSSLVHMFDVVRRELGSANSRCFAHVGHDGGWTLSLPQVSERLENCSQPNQPIVILGTAFTFVHLLDYLAEQNTSFSLPAGSRALETGGYKGRSRVIPKPELHRLITRQLGIVSANIICEYGMSELSSQAYDGVASIGSRDEVMTARAFHFPPWARAQIISPETGREVAEGETGLIRVLDLANVRSIAAVQTEDLGVRRGHGFELIGRAAQAEPRGCSLMAI